MVSSYTTNKNLEKPGNGDYVDTWNIPVNADLNVIDAALGSVTSLNATSGSANLSTSQYQNLALNVTGSMSANVTYSIPSGVGGFWIVRNATTDAGNTAYNVTIASLGGGSNVTVIRGRSSMVWSDGTNIRDVSENIPSIGTVTSVDVSGGTTGLTTSGGPITTNGTITIAGTLATTNGGTGLTSFAGANSAIYATSNSALTSGTLPITAGGTGITSFGTGVQTALGANVTGSGGIVLDTAPNIANATINTSTFVSAALGTPASGNLINTTSIPMANATGNLAVSNGGTGTNALTANNVILGNGTSAVQFVSPSTNGNVLVSNGTTWTSGARLNAGTAVAPTSGSQIDFTGIPSWAKRITVIFNALDSTGGDVLVQIGAGSITSSGYISTGMSTGTASTSPNQAATSTSAFIIRRTPVYGHMIITNVSGNIWVSSHVARDSTTTMKYGGGNVTLSGTLDRLRLSLSGTDTFSSGSVNIFWE